MLRFSGKKLFTSTNYKLFRSFRPFSTEAEVESLESKDKSNSILYKELTKIISSKTDLPVKNVDLVLKTFAQLLNEEVLTNGKELRFIAVGTFHRYDLPARKARNPRTGEAIDCVASSSVRLVTSSALKSKTKKIIE